jgi:hypothetical protein
VSDTITISRAEYDAMRTLVEARLREGPRNRKPYRRPRLGDPLTWQEQEIIDILREEHPSAVRVDELVVKVKSRRGDGAGVGEFNPLPASQISRIRDKLGHHVIRTVWEQRVNDAGRLVRDQARGASYLWVGL